MKQGWVKLHRQITDWEWYTDGNTFRVFLHLLLNANHKDGRHKGIVVKRGQILTGRKVLASALGLSERQIRTALSKLKTTGEIDQQKANKTTKSGSIITLCNYDSYQDGDDINDQETNKQTTKKRPTNDQQTTTNKNVKNEKNEINIDDDDFYKNSFVIEPEELKRKKVAAKKEIDNFVFPEVEETDTLKIYFENPTNVEFWGQKYPLLSIENEFANIYTSLQKKAANGNVQLSNPYSYVKKCLENAEKGRQQRVLAQRELSNTNQIKFNKKAEKARADVSDWSNPDFFA